MAQRVTNRDLENLTEHLNKTLGRPCGGQLPGQFYIGGEYNQTVLREVVSEHGGTTKIAQGTKREVRDYLSAMISGIRYARLADSKR